MNASTKTLGPRSGRADTVCASCPFATRAERPVTDRLECRRGPPAPDEYTRHGRWPLVEARDFCAAHPSFGGGAAAGDPRPADTGEPDPTLPL